MEKVHQVTTREIGWEKIEEILKNNQEIVLSDEVVERISACRDYLDRRLENEDEVLYGEYLDHIGKKVTKKEVFYYEIWGMKPGKKDNA